MNKNQQKQKRIVIDPKNKTFALLFKIVIVISFIFIIFCTVYYFIEVNNNHKSYFTVHFAVPCILFFVGINALLLARLSKMSVSGESKGDNFMIIVGLLLILFSFISLAMSYF